MFLFFLTIDLYFLIPVVIAQFFNRIAELPTELAELCYSYRNTKQESRSRA